ncbi:MAG: right-handed parallel beta-helix repeat-containing protein, partial [Planctomycetes bacterium]|nr:right-handed parallel beta-helix repeat-containing protein [Planctomycetota bacterium]
MVPRNRRASAFCIALCLALGSLRVGLAITLHVSPGGDDGASGRSPAEALASLRGARDAIRRLKEGGPLTEPVRVLVSDGRYFLAETFVLEPQDSGTESAPIVYEAAAGARPVFTGGRRIRGFRPAGGGLWSARIPEVAAGEWMFEQLWIDGRRAVRARSPNR